MIEVELQTLIKLSVRSQGGAAHKLSNRFMVGVSDLLVKLPSFPAALIEVKHQRFSAKVSDDRVFKLDVTVPQQQFLRAYRQAGMRCGIASGIQKGRHLYLLLLVLDRAHTTGYTARVGDHVAMGAGEARMDAICQQLRGFLI